MVLFAFILTLYLLADGRRTFDWVIAYVPRAHRPRTDATIAGVTEARRLTEARRVAAATRANGRGDLVAVTFDNGLARGLQTALAVALRGSLPPRHQLPPMQKH